MTDSFALESYLRRIGYTGPREPTLPVLREIHRLHPMAIAFENLDPLLRRPVGLDAVTVQRKLVTDGRGGWCFEHNGLLRQALLALGYRVTGLAARVLWNQPEDAITPRGHMLLRVEVEGFDYIVDVGFGGQTLTGPLRLEAGIDQETPHEPFRLADAGGYYRLQARLGDGWSTLYRFDLTEQFPVDYEVSNHYLATHPSSHFLQGLIAARAETGRRYALQNNRLTIHHLGGETERRELASVAEMRRVLADDFRIALSELDGLDAALERLLG